LHELKHTECAYYLWMEYNLIGAFFSYMHA